MAVNVNWAKMSSNTGGTANLTLTAIAGEPSLTQALGNANTDIYYVISTLYKRETGTATYYPTNSTSGVLGNRTVIESWDGGSSYGTATINFTPGTTVDVFSAPVHQLVVHTDIPQTISGAKTFTSNVNASGVVITANVFSGNGSGLTSLNATALSTGTVPVDRLPAANTTANGVVTISTQTFTGNKTFDADVTITGNLTLIGQATNLNVNNVIVTDSLIQLAANNTTSDALDIGLYGNYNPDGGDHEHTGLFRDASDGVWKLFVGLQDAPNTTINTSGTGYTVGTLQSYLTSGIFQTNATALTITANSSYSATLTVNTVNAQSVTADLIGNVTGTASNATNLNSQPGSYYTNASNLNTGILPLARLDANVLLTTSTTGINASALSTGTVAIARLDANVILTTSTTGINASALSTGTVPLDRLTSANTSANGVVDTTTQSFAGNKTFTDNVSVSGVITGNLTGDVLGTANNATYLNSQPDSYYTNASNLSTGTLPDARLAGAYTNVTSLSLGANVVANVTTVFVGNSTANSVHTATSLSVANSTNSATLTPVSLTIGATVMNTTAIVLPATAGLSANGSIGTNGQLLYSNGTTAYWSTPTYASTDDVIALAIALG